MATTMSSEWVDNTRLWPKLQGSVSLLFIHPVCVAIQAPLVLLRWMKIAHSLLIPKLQVSVAVLAVLEEARLPSAFQHIK